MKKVLLMIFCICLIAGAWVFYAVGLDYNKIVLVLPSSKRASSPYFYKKDGDFFLANDLKLGFEKLGYEVEYRFREDFDEIDFGDAGNVIYFKGYYNFENLPKDGNTKRKSLLYIYYVEGLYENILTEADVVVSASGRFIDEFVKSKGLSGEVIYQYTNPDRFKFGALAGEDNIEVLFVGSNHTGRGRKSVDYAVKSGADLSLYGKFWDKGEYQEALKGSYIDNDELYKYYANAKIVLNDHRQDMAYWGFVSNRIYDVSASGGFVFTDYMKEIEAEYGDSIAMYKDFDEFKEKLEYYLTHEEERKDMVKRAYKITLEKFTNVKAAEKFVQILKNIKK